MELFEVYPLYPIEPVRGQGAYVYDANGQHVFTGLASDPNTIRLLPALTISEAEVRRFIRTFSQSVQNNQPEKQPA